MKVLLILGVIGTFFYILDTWKMYRLWKQGEQMVSYKACAAAFGGLILMKVFEVLKSVAGYSPERWQSFAELVAVAVVLFLFLHFYENMVRYR